MGKAGGTLLGKNFTHVLEASALFLVRVCSAAHLVEENAVEVTIPHPQVFFAFRRIGHLPDPVQGVVGLF
jgi:hypothetical protein